MIGDRSKFVELDTKVTGQVHFRDESKVEIKGKGTILFELKNGSHKILPNVYYIPKMKNNILSIRQFMENPSETHMKAAKRILRYLKGTLEYGMFYSTSDEFKLMGYCDSDYAGDIDSRKSTIGFFFFLGNNVIS